MRTQIYMRTRHVLRASKGLYSLLFIFVMLGGGPPQILAQNVLLEEVLISLYNRPVTGYRVLLDRNHKFVQEQVLAHVSAHDASPPFRFGQNIIYENMRYRPISEARDLSMYYMVRDLEGYFTELTLVVMYDYRRSVNSRDFPVLSLRVQADIAYLVRRINGDILRSQHLVFDDKTLFNIKNKISTLAEPERKSVRSEGVPIGSQGNLVEQFQEEEVENEGVLLKGDPFSKGHVSKIEASVEANHIEDQIPDKGLEKAQENGTNPEVQHLRARIVELEVSNDQLNDRISRMEKDHAVMKRKEELLENKLAESREVWDSIAVLNRRVEEMTGHYYLADDFSISNESALQLQELEQNARRNEKQLQILALKKDSLQSLNLELQELLAKTGNSARERAREIRRLKKENKLLLEKQTQANYQEARLEAEARFEAEARLDKVVKEQALCNRERNLLETEITILQTKIDSMETAAVPNIDQGSFVREQWARLQSWEKDLNSRSKSVEDKEKLLQQREKYIEEQGGLLSNREEQLKGLEEREKELKALEQMLKASKGTGPSSNDLGSFKVKDGRVMEFGNMIHVFVVDTDLSYKNAQRRIVAYMLNRNELLNEQFPNLVFTGATISELSSDPVDVQVRIDPRSATSCTIQVSFKTSAGVYIGAYKDRDQTEAARQLVAQMIRFQF